jgi:hypothetical protein
VVLLPAFPLGGPQLATQLRLPAAELQRWNIAACRNRKPL